MRIVVLLAAIITIAFAVIQHKQKVAPGTSAHHMPIGARDFVAYWSGFQVFIQGKDPYLESHLTAVQKPLNLPLDGTQMFITPPWALPLLSPLLALPFDLARFALLALNLIFLFLIGLSVKQYLDTTHVPQRIFFLAVIAFIPSFFTMFLGQLSLLVTACLAGTFVALQRKRDYLAGLLLVPVSLKPHLVYLVVLALALWIFREKRFRIIWGFALGFCALAAILVTVSPHIFENWLEAPFSPLQWKTATLVTVLREYLLSSTGNDHHWPVVVVPLITVVIALCWLIKNTPTSADWPYLLPPLLALSLITAPYAWPFDFSLLLILQLTIIILSLQQEKKVLYEMTFWLVLSQLSILAVSSAADSLQSYFHFPILMLLIWLRFSYLMKKREAR